ncbi:10923_t:CDS:2 [Ambispora gerdemannii]|uniref:10923_t:CDS:1 n=1 Tax=Ambispora gerdemannii TaxID=144530 RepID=A0A9N9A7I1_9GLOM|nr:10923_t:CDS:2 [Ambispora gerdemannii]
MEQTYSNTSAGDKIEVYEFLEALGLLDNEVSPENYWNPRKTYTGWDYKRRFGEDALKKLYQTREARHRNIVLMEFTRRLPDISDREKNRLFDAFSRSNAFGVKEHNALLDALADPVKGWDLNNY